MRIPARSVPTPVLPEPPSFRSVVQDMFKAEFHAAKHCMDYVPMDKNPHLPYGAAKLRDLGSRYDKAFHQAWAVSAGSVGLDTQEYELFMNTAQLIKSGASEEALVAPFAACERACERVELARDRELTSRNLPKDAGIPKYHAHKSVC